MTLQEWLSANASELQGFELVNDPRLEVEVLASNVLQLDRAHLLARLDNHLTDNQLQQLGEVLEKRKQHIPTAYITGRKEFFGIDFFVNENVLIPRPETEDLVSYIIKNTPKYSRVIDVGTGSGCVAVSLKYYRPDLAILASDTSTAALDLAEKNAEHNKCDITFVEADIVKGINCLDLDLVVANLPYVPSGRTLDPDVQHEPASALYSGADGLDHYNQLFSQLAAHPNLTVVIEAEPKQSTSLKNIAKDAGFLFIERSNYCYVFKSI